MNNGPIPSKIHIDLQRGVVEAEGDAAFVKKVYEDFKKQLAQTKVRPAASKPANRSSSQAKPSIASNGAGKPKAKGKAAAASKNGKLDKDLNLYGGDNIPPLKDYLAGFNATTNMHKNVVFISYLMNQLGLDTINIDHIFTCYHAVDKIPKALLQSLYDTSDKGLIYFSADAPNPTLAVPGMNWLKSNTKTSEIAAK